VAQTSKLDQVSNHAKDWLVKYSSKFWPIGLSSTPFISHW